MSATKRILHDQDGVLVGVLKNWRLNPMSAANRNALTSVLSSIHVGLSVFDTDDTLQYFWTGSTWVTTSGSSYILPKATTVSLGGIIVGDNLTIDGTGRLSALSGAVLTSDLTVELGANNSVGGVDDQDFYPTGTPLETLLRDILTNAVHPIYLSPTLSISGTSNQDLEVGVTVSPTISTVFTQNDAGSLTSRRIYRNATVISNAASYTDSNYTVQSGATQYSSQVDYAAGIIKNDNLGNPDAVGQITSGTVTSNIIQINGYRNAFYQAITTSIPSNSSQVRALTGKLLNPSGKDFIINIPVGSVNVVFAIPSTLTLNYVQYLELSDSDIKEAFTSSNINVEGANGFTAIGYKVYSYTPVEPYTVEVNYRVNAQ